MAEQFEEVFFEWVYASTDPAPYKPYSPGMKPINLQVKVRVPTKYIASITGKGKKRVVILTPAGMAFCCKQFANALAAVHSQD